MKLNTFISMIYIIISLSLSSVIFAQELNSMSLEELMNVKIITAGKTQQKVSDVPASVVILSRKDIEMYGYQDLKEIINQINGMYIMSNLGIDIYAVRGFTKGKGNNFVIMINNMKIKDEKILTYYRLPVEMIDRIEIVRGPMSVIYGNNAFFGVINIITNKISGNEPDNLSSLSYGSLNTSKYFTRLSSKSDNLKIVLNLSLYKSNGADLPLNKMITKPERMDEPLFGGLEGLGLSLPDYAKTTKDFLSNNHKYINLSASIKKFTFNFSYVEAKNGWYYYYPSLDTGSVFKNRNTTFALNYSNKINNNVKIDAELRYSRSNYYNKYHHIFEGFYGWDRYNTSELDGELNIFWKPVNNLNLIFGVQYENMMEAVNDSNVPLANINNDTFYFIDNDYDGITYSTFAQADYNPISKLKIVVGLRLEQMMGYGLKIKRNQGLPIPSDDFVSTISDTKENGEIYVIPRLAAIYQINNNNFIKFLYGKAIKRPSYSIIGEDLWDIFLGEKPDGYSKPEFIHTRELNYMSSITHKLSLNFSLFWNTLDNLIVEKNAIVDNVLRAWLGNAGRMETKGIETSLSFASESNFNFEIGGTYQKTKDLMNDVPASFSPNLIGYFKIAYNSSNKYIFSLTGNYRGSMKPFYSNSPIIDDSEIYNGEVIGWTSQEVSDYFVVSGNIKIKDFIFKGAFIIINCSNLFNTTIYYPTFSINNAWADRGTLGLKRGFLITFGWKF